MSLDTPVEARRAARRVSTPTVVIVGATGAVGMELLRSSLEQRGFPHSCVAPTACVAAVGRT